MKGLLLKDLYVIKGFGKQYGVVLAALLVFSVVINNMSMVTIYTIVMSGMLVLSTLSVDEAAHFDRWSLTTPAGAKNLVGEKYVLLLLTMGAGIAIGVLFNGIAGIFWEGADAGVAFFLPPVLMFTIAYAAALPATFKAGIEKARYIYMGIMFGISIIMAGLYKMGAVFGITLGEMEESMLFKGNGIVLTLGIAGICILALAVSYRISLKMVRNREW